MDTRTGKIMLAETAAALAAADPNAARFLKQMIVSPTPKQMRRRPPRVGRNEPWPRARKLSERWRAMPIKRIVHSHCPRCGKQIARLEGQYVKITPCGCGPPGPPSPPRRLFASDVIFKNDEDLDD